MANKRISFVVDFTTEFGAAVTTLKVRKCDTMKSQFEAALLVLPKWIFKTWEAITFEFGEQKIEVCKRWLDETENDFEKSFQIVE